MPYQCSILNTVYVTLNPEAKATLKGAPVAIASYRALFQNLAKVER